MTKTIIPFLKNACTYALLSIVILYMLKGIVIYYPLRDDVGFLLFKKPYLNIWWWKIAFYTHVFSIIFALLAGTTQFSNFLLRRHKNIHRLMGKIYVYDILIVNFPAAMIMAVYANGLLPGKMAFILLDSLWFWFTYKAVVEIKKGNVRAHKEYMIRSYTLTLSAVMLRLWKIIISRFINIDPVHLYMIDSWMGFVPNLLFAEWLIRNKAKVIAAKGISRKTDKPRPKILPQS